MKVFDHPNLDNFRCPLCGMNTDRPVVLVPIAGTQDDGICEAEQVHHDCLLEEVVFYKDQNVIAARGIL